MSHSAPLAAARSAPPPRRLGRPRLLIVGCGDIGLRVARLLGGRWRLIALTSDPSRRALLRAAGVAPLVGDLDRPATLRRLAGLAPRVLHLAPPAPHGGEDRRTANLLRVLSRAAASTLRRLVYVGTTGVYGDAGGALVDEAKPARPATDRARRRVDAERRLRAVGRPPRHAARPRAAHPGRRCRPCPRTAVVPRRPRVTLLRAPGIYALDRPGGDPRERLRRGTPVLLAADDGHTNHIHADDLARACIAALHRGPAQRAYNVSDDGDLKTGDHYDLVARLAGLPPPPRIGRAEAQARLTPMQLSFLGESRRLANGRMKRELRLVLRYPTVAEAFGAQGG